MYGKFLIATNKASAAYFFVSRYNYGIRTPIIILFDGALEGWGVPHVDKDVLSSPLHQVCSGPDALRAVRHSINNIYHRLFLEFSFCDLSDVRGAAVFDGHIKLTLKGVS